MEELQLLEKALDKAAQKGAFTLAESHAVANSLQKVASIVSQATQAKEANKNTPLQELSPVKDTE